MDFLTYFQKIHLKVYKAVKYILILSSLLIKDSKLEFKYPCLTLS